MERVGVRELKNRATQIVRAVREDHAEYLVPVDGEPDDLALGSNCPGG